jgi:hypothetical protein
VYTILGGRIIFLAMVQNLLNLAMHIAAVLENMVLFLSFLDNGFLFLFFYFGM